MRDLEGLGDDDLRRGCEAMLLVSVDPVSAASLAQALGASPSALQEALSSLSAEYADAGRGFQLREVAGGWRLYTHPAQHDVVERYVRSWDTHRLTQAALETLAVIAYNQPATREGVRSVRGVSSDSAISSLVDKGLVRELGRRDGGAILYGTTQLFLETFGLRSVSELPPLSQFAPDEATRQLIAERLSARPVQGTLEELGDGAGPDGDDDDDDPLARAAALGGDAGDDEGSEG